MNKRDYFIASLLSGAGYKRAWSVSIFSLINESAEAYKKDPYPYRLVQIPTGFFFVDPNKNNELTKIDDTKIGEPLFSVTEKLTVTKEDNIPNLKETIITTYGNLYFNYVVLCYSVGDKIPYQNKRINVIDTEFKITSVMQDTPIENIPKEKGVIYVDEYLKFCDAIFSLVSLTQICVPSATEKVITPAPGISEYKNKLLLENKDKLTDPAVIAKIDALLVEYDKAYLKGDLGEGFLINEKSYNVVRKRLFGMQGAETGLTSTHEVDLISNSLNEGWDMSKFPTIINTLRSGSFDRGAQTQLGGESVKWLLRSSSNINITEDDCGSTLGITFDIDDINYDKLINFYVIKNNESTLIENEEQAQKYINKKVMVRSPMYCKLGKTDYCKKCCGTNLSQHPTGASVAISEFGSIILTLFLKKMHGKTLSLSVMDYKRVII